MESQGLEVIYEPEASAHLDIIFVHGVGATSLATWSQERRVDKFWPQRWLPYESAIRTARILIFGYNDCFISTDSAVTIDINGIAQELLDCVQSCGKTDLGIGQVRGYPQWRYSAANDHISAQ